VARVTPILHLKLKVPNSSIILILLPSEAISFELFVILLVKGAFGTASGYISSSDSSKKF